jgi:predicted kinase
VRWCVCAAQMWVTEAKRYGATHIEAIYFDVPKEECIRRASLRRGHPTLSAAKVRLLQHATRDTAHMPRNTDDDVVVWHARRKR